MKKLILTLVFVLYVSSINAFAAEWLACDPQPGIVSYAIVLDADPEIIIPYRLNTAGTDVLLWDVTYLDAAHFEIWAINDQGRRSDSDPNTEGNQPVPFDLKAAPPPLSGYRIIVE